jgi:hypothetical protein
VEAVLVVNADLGPAGHPVAVQRPPGLVPLRRPEPRRAPLRLLPRSGDHGGPHPAPPSGYLKSLVRAHYMHDRVCGITW